MRIALVLALLALAQQPTGWKYTSPHVTRFITVGKDLRLEVLDWGGSGRAVVLLAAGGDTAHVFDDFAPRLARDFHVYGITRRGFGQSGFVPAAGADAYGDDVLAVTSALALNRPVLVGHSVGGQELSSVATRYPSRVESAAVRGSLFVTTHACCGDRGCAPFGHRWREGPRKGMRGCYTSATRSW